MLRAAMDIGGTFTDCFIVWEGCHVEGKALTTHHNLAVGFLEAVANAAAELQVFVISLVNSVVNPLHEEQVEEIIREEYPSSLLGSYPVILSHRISRRKSEYARTMAAVICGFLHEPMLQIQDMKVRLSTCLKIRERVEEIAREYSWEAMIAQSMMTFFPAFTALQMVVPKFLHACVQRYTKIHAPWYNMITTFIYCGVNQHGETVGNLCADLNGMSGGAREDADGESSITPIFAAMTDMGEQEVLEEETPIVKIVPHRQLCDNQGFGRRRGGTGYQVIATVRRSDLFGFMTTCVGSKFPSTYGLFGGYGAPTYPLCKVKGVDAFEQMVDLPE